MDVRSIEDVEPVVEHNGTVPVWWLFKSREMKEITDGGFLELVNEFEVAGGGYVDPHSHPTHEFYYVTLGPRHHDHRGRGPPRRPGRPRPHPPRQGPQPASGERPRADPLLLLRHRREGLGADRLHQPLSGACAHEALGARWPHPRHPPSPRRRPRPAASTRATTSSNATTTRPTPRTSWSRWRRRRRRGVPAHRPHRRARC